MTREREKERRVPVYCPGERIEGSGVDEENAVGERTSRRKRKGEGKKSREGITLGGHGINRYGQTACSTNYRSLITDSGATRAA